MDNSRIVRFCSSNSGYCRDYYANENKTVYARQLDSKTVVGWYTTTPEGEPSCPIRQGLTFRVYDNHGKYLGSETVGEEGRCKKSFPFSWEIKTMADWNGSLSDCFRVGDLVSEEIVEWFINVLPPACLNGSCIQIGEPYSHVDGHATYPTLKNTAYGWVYAGNCFHGQTEKVSQTV